MSSPSRSLGSATRIFTIQPVAVRVAVYDRRVAVEGAVRLDDLAGHRAVQLGDRLHRLDGAEGLMGVELVAGLGEIHEHHVAQLTLRVVGDPDADDPGLAGRRDVFMLGVYRRSSGTFDTAGSSVWSRVGG